MLVLPCSLGPSKSCRSPPCTLFTLPLNQSPAAAVRHRHTSAGLEDDRCLTLQSEVRSPEWSPRAPAQPGLGRVFPGLREGPAPFLASEAAFFLSSRPVSVQNQQSHHCDLCFLVTSPSLTLTLPFPSYKDLAMTLCPRSPGTPPTSRPLT